MDLATILVPLSLIYFAVAAVMWASSREERKEIERKKDLELARLREKLKKLSEKAKKRKRKIR